MSRYTLFAALASLVCALAATWEAVKDPGGALLCNFVHPDCPGNQWILVWLAEQVLSGGSILHNDAYYWPVGDSPWLAGNGSEGFAYLPWHVLLGFPAASNAHLVSVLFLNGMAAYALARASGASPVASVPAAPTGAILAYAIQEMGAGRFTQVSFCWMGFFLASWLWFLGAPSTRRGVLAAALLAVTCVFYWYYGLFGVLAGGILLLFRRPPLRPLLVFAGTFLVLVTPLLLVFLSNYGGIVGTGEDALFPHPEALKDATWPGIPFWLPTGRHAGRALPFTTCILAVAALRDRAAWALGAVAVFFAALMAGPLIPYGPYEWVYGLAGPLRRFWWPYRHVVLLNLVLVALSARGLQIAITRLGPRQGVALAVALSVAVPLQLDLQGAPWKAQFTIAEVPVDFYRSLRSAPGDILLEPPLAPQVASSQAQLIYQIDHRKKLVTGHAMWVDRVRPDAWDDAIAANSFLTRIQQLDRAELAGTFTFEAADLQSLLDQGMRTFVVNEEYYPVTFRGLIAAYEEINDAAFGEATHRGKRVTAWDMGRWNGETTFSFTPWEWPKGLSAGGPTLPIQRMRPPSLALRVPAGDKKPPPPPPGP